MPTMDLQQASEQAPRFTLLDLCMLQTRGPTRAETLLLATEESGRRRRKLVAHTASELQYRKSLSGVSFLGTYIYTQVFSFVIYFAVVFAAISLPAQPLFWLAVWEFRSVVLGTGFLIIMKLIINSSLQTRLEMSKGHYCGMKHPRQSSYFDFMITVLTCLVGWAPALSRVLISFVASLLLVPRLDLKLPGASFDSSHTKFQGLMEMWRIQMEYQKVCDARARSVNETVNPLEQSRMHLGGNVGAGGSAAGGDHELEHEAGSVELGETNIKCKDGVASAP